MNLTAFAEQPSYDKETGDHILIGLPVALFKTDNHVYEIQYDITNGKIGASLVDLPARELIFTINAAGDGHLTVYLPREIIDSKRNGLDKPYLVYVGDLYSGLKRTTADEIVNDDQMRVLTINFTKGENEIGILGSYFIENKSQDAPINLYGNFSPRIQFEKGIDPEDVICKEGFQPIIKSNNGHPACVKPETKTRLIERGWTTTDYHPIFAVVIGLPVLNDYANLPPNHVKITLGNQIDDYDSGVTFHPPDIKTIIGYNNTVTWINQNDKSVKLESDDGYFDGEIQPGESFSVRFDKIGVYRYHSSDNWKRGTIIVSTQEIESTNLKVADLLKKNPDDIASTIAVSLISHDKIVKKRLDNTIMSAYVTDEDADIIVPKALCLLCGLHNYDGIEYRYGMKKALVYPKDESAALDFAKDFLTKIGYNVDGSEWIDKVNFGDHIEVSIQQRVQGWIIPNHIARFEFYKDNTWISLGRWYNDISEYKFKLSQDDTKKIAKEYMDLEANRNPNLQKYEYQFESISDGVRVIIFDDKPLYVVPISYKASAKMNYENGHCGGPEFFSAYVMVEGQKGAVLGWDYTECY